MDLKSLISIEKTTKFYQLVTDSGPWHTHIALCDKDLYVCRFLEFASPLGGAIIDDRTPVLMNQFSRAQDNRRSERDAINLAAHGYLTVHCSL